MATGAPNPQFLSIASQGKIIVDTIQPATTSASDRLQRLRDELRRRELNGFFIPHSDEHQGEYIPASAERLAWLTGFTGSAGAAVVLEDRAALFVDGRYTLQAAKQSDTTLYQQAHLIEQPPHSWLAQALRPGARLGYDPWLLTRAAVSQLDETCRQAGAILVPCATNPLDAVWTDRPKAPESPIVPHPVEFSGLTSEQKRSDLARVLADGKLDAAVLSAPESIAWLLNLRADDVPHTPLPLAFGILYQDGTVDLFAAETRLSPQTRRHLGNAVRVLPPDTLGDALDRLKGKRVRLDQSSAPAWIGDRLAEAGATADLGADPCALPRATKNAVELEGFRRAHRRDGAALVRFLAWLEAAAPSQPLTEISVADRLEDFRRTGEHFQGLSFSTISAAGPNAALPHYHATPEDHRALELGQLYLVDSGGQYLDGTTDVTRTVAIGTAGAEERRRFTQVLKGHIALARCRFPKGTTGSQIDCLARLALWADGVDYDHGTGHGVGSYLSVHEGPQRIAKLPNSQPLLPGMILSDEPGYYKEGAFGIRTENLLAVRRWEGAAERETYEFEVLTLAPIDLALIDRDALTAEEIDWLNRYHARVRDDLTPLLDAPTAAWLAQATRAL
jgi:Xaa-Pro aminopeptidase